MLIVIPNIIKNTLKIIPLIINNYHFILLTGILFTNFFSIFVTNIIPTANTVLKQSPSVL